MVATAIAVATFVVYKAESRGFLHIKIRQTGETVASFEISEGEQFEISFIHSVNKSPVHDRYTIEQGEIMIYETQYFGFGAGVQTELVGDQQLIMGDDGSMTITNINTKIENLAYNISPVYDHVLMLDGEQISLKQLCFPERGIVIAYEN